MIEGIGRPARLTRALLGFVLVLSGCSDPVPVDSWFLTDVRDDWVLSEAEAIAWHDVKDAKGPAFTGNASWHQFVGLAEEKLGDYGVVDIQRNQWNFTRWYTSEWPDRWCTNA